MRIQDVIIDLQKVIPDKRVSIRLQCEGTLYETEVFEVVEGTNGNLVLDGIGQPAQASSNSESEVY